MFAETREFSATQFVKTRCATDGTPTFLGWSGYLYSFTPDQPKRKLFQIVGMNVARCIDKGDGVWDFASREVNLYLDPETGKIQRHWQNPWTGEMLPVMHVANSPIQGTFRRNIPAEVDGDTATFVFDLFAHYPNPLADDPKFAEYCDRDLYNAAELFKLSVPLADLESPDTTTVSKLSLSWHRVGPWLPWMKMGQREGNLIYSASGKKVKDFDALPHILKKEIETRIPLFKDAPPAKVEGEEMTSWQYFKQHFEAYQQGATFPIPTV
ncbi:DUF1838 domain-containing protein [Pseudanabaena mucicola]|uniref:DUF1838 domain-containing protein n=1 Tax=Pseudanabaena mucicola FACHB-723 TaxID=2692860 RepID=A0ABR7ZYA4_9CYAN|nr:DUF1838 domain-containing protein [Pseudanabaena mucicola]MBD2188961.1 DUF1838 domain-containing protein [Pseudanabaena mucicola FACHB-723]